MKRAFSFILFLLLLAVLAATGRAGDAAFSIQFRQEDSVDGGRTLRFGDDGSVLPQRTLLRVTIARLYPSLSDDIPTHVAEQEVETLRAEYTGTGTVLEVPVDRFEEGAAPGLYRFTIALDERQRSSAFEALGDASVAPWSTTAFLGSRLDYLRRLRSEAPVLVNGLRDLAAAHADYRAWYETAWAARAEKENAAQAFLDQQPLALKPVIGFRETMYAGSENGILLDAHAVLFDAGSRLLMKMDDVATPVRRKRDWAEPACLDGRAILAAAHADLYRSVAHQVAWSADGLREEIRRWNDLFDAGRELQLRVETLREWTDAIEQLTAFWDQFAAIYTEEKLEALRAELNACADPASDAAARRARAGKALDLLAPSRLPDALAAALRELAQLRAATSQHAARNDAESEAARLAAFTATETAVAKALKLCASVPGPDAGITPEGK